MAENSNADKTTENQETRLYHAITGLQNDLKEHLKEVSAKYGLDYSKMEAVINCESTWNINAFGDDGRSFGLCQFLKTTFEENCYGDYYNPYDQIECMGLMWSKGLQKRWTCYRKLYGI